MRDPRLTKLEDDLRKIPGVKGARIVGAEAPTEIHIVATSDRSPKQVVRDVQSLAAAGFSMPIDHRIVSIVQLDESANGAAASTPEPANSLRPAVDRIVVASKGEDGWVKVALKWPDGELTEGAGAAGVSRETRARAAAVATQRAIEPKLGTLRKRVDIDQVQIVRIGANETVSVSVVMTESGKASALVGSALIYDDVATAAVRATLDAINRKL